MRAMKVTVVLLLALVAVLGVAYAWKQSPMSDWLARDSDRGAETVPGDGDAPAPAEGDRPRHGRDGHGGHGGSVFDIAESVVPIVLVTAALAGYDRVTRRRRRARRIRLTT